MVIWLKRKLPKEYSAIEYLLHAHGSYNNVMLKYLGCWNVTSWQHLRSYQDLTSFLFSHFSYLFPLSHYPIVLSFSSIPLRYLFAIIPFLLSLLHYPLTYLHYPIIQFPASFTIIPFQLTLRKSGCQHHDLISHLVTLSWPWTNQLLSYIRTPSPIITFVRHWFNWTESWTPHRC